MLYKLKTYIAYFKYLPQYFKLTANDNTTNNPLHYRNFTKKVYSSNNGNDLVTIFTNSVSFTSPHDYKSMITTNFNY